MKNGRRNRQWIFALCLTALVFLLLACNDWDGMDRSDWVTTVEPEHSVEAWETRAAERWIRLGGPSI